MLIVRIVRRGFLVMLSTQRSKYRLVAKRYVIKFVFCLMFDYRLQYRICLSFILITILCFSVIFYGTLCYSNFFLLFHNSLNSYLNGWERPVLLA